MYRRSRIPIIATFLSAAVIFSIIGFAIGYYGFSPSADKKEEQITEKARPFQEGNIQGNINNTEKNEAEDTAVTQLESSINAETIIKYRTLYTVCNNIKEEVYQPSAEFIGLNERGLSDYLYVNYPQIELVSFTSDEVILLERKDQVCPGYYLISENGGYITVYQYNEKGEKIEVEKTDIPVSALPLVDQEKLRKGIFLKTIEEVYQLLEDYGS